MNRPRYESLEEARSSLEYSVSHELIDDAFEAVETAARELVDEYELDGDVDVGDVETWLKVSFCESAVMFFEEGIWENEDDMRDIIKDIENEPVSNAKTLVGTQIGRGKDMMRISGTMLKRQYSNE